MAGPMKLLFVHPGPLLYTNVFLRLEPLGLELVAEAARRARHSVRIIDLQVESHADYHRTISEWQPRFCRLFLQLPRQCARDCRSG
jgi:magnesium-protoporphyrin IX monomethyl ester (oxidative) cyclase